MFISAISVMVLLCALCAWAVCVYVYDSEQRPTYSNTQCGDKMHIPDHRPLA